MSQPAVSASYGQKHQAHATDMIMSKYDCHKFLVKLVADTEKCVVKLTPIGMNMCGVNGFSVKQNVEYDLHHKDRLEIILDQYVHEIVFDPPPPDKLKRAREGSTEENGRKKRKNVSKQIGNVWEEIDGRKLLIFSSDGLESRDRIAAYDLDGTIIDTKSGARFAKDKDDWRIQFPEVIKMIQQLNSVNYKIVIFTNQLGIATGKVKVADLKEKIEAVARKLGVPLQAFVSTDKGIYRKPCPGMWDALVNKKNDDVEIDINNSFYCGDAAGRDKNWAPKKKKDHSIADRLFALNLKVLFYTPEEHFLGARKIAYLMPEFNPNLTPDLPLYEPKDSKLISDKPELIVFVGCPASGKTYISESFLAPKGYIHINRDKLGSWQKCVAKLETEIQKKKSVVIDNTNPDKESRKRYIEVAKKFNIPIRCFVMNTSIQQCKHNNVFREITDNTHVQVGEIIINSYKNKYEEPSLEEGFDEIIKFNCIPKFTNPTHKRLYQMYLLEK